jgi:hypothetical protein
MFFFLVEDRFSDFPTTTIEPFGLTNALLVGGEIFRQAPT